MLHSLGFHLEAHDFGACLGGVYFLQDSGVHDMSFYVLPQSPTQCSSSRLMLCRTTWQQQLQPWQTAWGLPAVGWAAQGRLPKVTPCWASMLLCWAWAEVQVAVQVTTPAPLPPFPFVILTLILERSETAATVLIWFYVWQLLTHV